MSETISLYIKRPKKDYRIYNTVLALLLYVGLGGIFLSLLGLNYSTVTLLIIGLVTILFSNVFIKSIKGALIGSLVYIGSSLLYYIVLNDFASKGLKLLLNGFTRLESIKTKTILAFWEIDAEATQYALINTIFLIPIAIFFAILIYEVVKHNFITFPVLNLALIIFAIKYYNISNISSIIVIPFVCSYIMVVRKYFNVSDVFATIIPILVIFMVFNIIALPFSNNIGSLFYKQNQSLGDKQHAKTFESVIQPLPEGKLDKYSDFLSKDNTVALFFDKPLSETLYLRAFIGETFKYGRWINVANENLYYEQLNTYNMHQNGFYSQNQVATIGKLLGYLGSDKLRSIEITLNDACKAYNYNGYGFYSSNDEILSDYSLDNSSLLPMESYSYQYYSLNSDDYKNLATILNDSSSVEIENYKTNERLYRNFVYRYYLEKDTSISKELSGITTSYGTKDYEMIISRVKTIADSYSFSNSLTKSSFAAKALRYYGVPSRYIEGYAIPAGKDCAEFVNAHAWVEYYIDGIGWAPFDLCADEIEKLEKNPPPVIEDTPEQSISKESKSQKDNIEKNYSILWYIPFFILIFVIISAIIARKIVLNYRNKYYFNDDIKLSVNYIYNRLLILLYYENYDMSNTDLYSLTNQIKSVLGADFANAYNYITKIAYSGIFANKTIGLDERENCIKIYRAFINNAKQQKKNLLYKYILWLY